MRIRDFILAAVAVISIIIYTLACRPAWHPDGHSVAFGFACFEDGGKSSGIAVYSLKTGELHTITTEKGERFAFSQVMWTKDGKNLIILAPWEKRENEAYIQVVRADPAAHQLEMVAEMAHAEAASSVILPPVLIHERYLCFYQELEKKGSIQCVDMKTGSATEFFPGTEQGKSAHVFGTEENPCYIRIAASPDNEDQIKEVIVGRFDPLASEHPEMFRINKVPPGRWHFITANQSGDRFAVVLDKEQSALAILDKSGSVVKEWPLPIAKERSLNMLWHKDTIYIAAQQESDIGILEVDAVSGKSRFISLYRGKRDEGIMFIQPALSPDGKFLAVSGLLYMDEKENPTALVLIDLASPERAVKKIPLPRPK